MRAVLFLLVLAGLSFVGYRYWMPGAEAAGPETPANQPSAGDFEFGGAAPDEPGRIPEPRAGTRGEPQAAPESEGDPEMGPARAQAASFAKLGAEGRWLEAAAATGGRNDFAFEQSGRSALEQLIRDCAKASPEDATLHASAVLDVLTCGRPYLADMAVRELFARLYQAQQDALGRSLVGRRGTWRSRSTEIRKGDALLKIARRMTRDLGVPISVGLLQLVNEIQDPASIRAGKTLRVPTDRMHVTVERSTHTLKLFVGPILLRIYPVGLGKQGTGTPAAEFVVRDLLRDPQWTDPVSKRVYQPGEPGNALGGYFIRLRHPQHEGYGIHGTDEQDSIGRSESLGCIRMRDGDIDELFSLMAEKVKVQVR
jgi:lipoprotein-anchoring transpeptidase ErfK/SrfK